MFGLRALRRSAAVFGAAAVLTVAVPVSSARADGGVDTVIKLTAGAVGSLAMRSPGVAIAAGRAVCNGPASCAVMAVGAAALVGFLTRDTWLPWVRNAFGGSDEGGTTAPDYYTVNSKTWPEGTSNVFQVDLTFNGPQGPGYGILNFTAQTQCKRTSDGSMVSDQVSYSTFMNEGERRVLSFEGCPGYGTQAQGYVVQRIDADWYGYNQPHNTAWWQRGSEGPVSARVTVTCRRPSGTEYTVVRDTAEVLSTDGLVEVGACAPGDTAVKTELAASTDGLTTVKPQWDIDLRPTPDDVQNYPQCVYQACLYRIWVNGRACDVGVVGCIDWSRRNSLDPSDPQYARARCMYGPYSVAIEACAPLERLYETGTTVITRENIDGKPGTSTAPAPPDVTWTDPVPPKDPQAPQDPKTPPGESDACWPEGWSEAMNPASWVLAPIKCALTWAFVPSPAALSGFSGRITTAFQLSSPGKWSAAIGDLGQSLSVPSGGCEGPAMALGPPFNVTLHPYSACDAPMSTIASALKVGLSAIVVVGGGFSVLRRLGEAIGYGGA